LSVIRRAARARACTTEPTSAATSDDGWVPGRPTAADLARQLRDVIVDVPRFAAAPLLRPWHRRWGATDAEVAAPMPGDDLLSQPQLRATRAITINAPPEQVWPWLVQVGCLRAGWYADDLLDNLAHPSAQEVVPELQAFEVGQWLPMTPRPTERTSFVVDSFEAPRWMLWRTPTSTWAWQLVPLLDERTRLITRLRVAYEWRHPGGIVLLELGDWPMMRRMLRGIRQGAEDEHRRRMPATPRPGRLALIKAVHTAAWASIEFCVGYLLWSGACGRSDRRAAGAAAVVAGECLVFAAEGFRCPLTTLAEHAGAGDGSVTDIYLPDWLARNLPAIHVPLLILIGWLHRRALRLGGRDA
jgi:hypothetical protein